MTDFVKLDGTNVRVLDETGDTHVTWTAEEALDVLGFLAANEQFFTETATAARLERQMLCAGQMMARAAILPSAASFSDEGGTLVVSVTPDYLRGVADRHGLTVHSVTHPTLGGYGYIRDFVAVDGVMFAHDAKVEAGVPV